MENDQLHFWWSLHLYLYLHCACISVYFVTLSYGQWSTTFLMELTSVFVFTLCLYRCVLCYSVLWTMINYISDGTYICICIYIVSVSLCTLLLCLMDNDQLHFWWNLHLYLYLHCVCIAVYFVTLSYGQWPATFLTELNNILCLHYWHYQLTLLPLAIYIITNYLQCIVDNALCYVPNGSCLMHCSDH